MTQKESNDFAPAPRSKKGLVVVGLGVIAVVAAVGIVGKLSGTGWFGHRSFLYGQGELYILNMHLEDRHVSVDGLPPVPVPKLNARLVDLIGGTSSVVISKDPEGTQVEVTKAVTIDGSSALLKLTDQKCLVVSDVTSFYQKGAERKLKVVHGIKATESLHVLGSTNIIWPSKPFPAHFKLGQGPVLWVELVGCDLLGDKEFLDTYLGVRLSERFAKAQAQ